MKHLIRWLVTIFGAKEIDAHSRAMPPSHKVMLFTKGITSLSRVSGHEHKKMCCILLGLVIDLLIPGGWDSTCLVCAMCALLDFLFLAQFQCHTSDYIDQLDNALSEFHTHKAIFTDLGVWDHYNIPKIHSLTHYVSSICLFETTDNYNTEQTERLHIDFAKNVYCSTNHKDIYLQMTAWLHRHEKMLLHVMHINQRQHKQSERPQTIPTPPCVATQTIKMAIKSTKVETFNILAQSYGAVNFLNALADFIACVNNLGCLVAVLQRKAEDTLIPFHRVPVFHTVKFTTCGDSGEMELLNNVHTQPGLVDMQMQNNAPWFDTIVVHQDSIHGQGNKGMVLSYQIGSPN